MAKPTKVDISTETEDIVTEEEEEVQSKSVEQNSMSFEITNFFISHNCINQILFQQLNYLNQNQYLHYQLQIPLKIIIQCN